MKTCTHNCTPLCDFCVYFDFNANAEGAYVEAGHCRKHNKRTDPEDVCDEFVCAAVRERNMTEEERKALVEKRQNYISKIGEQNAESDKRTQEEANAAPVHHAGVADAG